MQYTITIPKPTAKRMEAHRTLTITYTDGWNTSRKAQYQIPPNTDTYTFELKEPIEHRDPHTLDKAYHQFTITYYNTTKTRKEEKSVTPHPTNTQ